MVKSSFQKTIAPPPRAYIGKGGSMKGIFVGRMCPIHLGHELVIKEMNRECGNNSLVIIGSSSAPISLRHFFSYEDRRGFLRRMFPDQKVVGLPDYQTDQEWLTAMDDILVVAGINPAEAVFFGGCEEDIRFFLEAGRKYKILNRFTGETPKISATEVRDSLIHNRELDGLLNPIIAEEVKNTFRCKWEVFKKI